MKIAVSATNPCHLHDLAKAWHELGALGAYHSGYPRWRLRPPAGFPLRAHAWRTVITYAALRLPRSLRPSDLALFRWQDEGFDRAVGNCLSRRDGELVHAMPGQALHTFRTARSLGVETCLNHASGPLRRQHAAIVEANRKVGLPPPPPPPAEELERRDAECALADWHCVASSLVRDQLVADGVAAERIWVAPYAAAPELFFAPAAPREPSGRIVFAGQITARKGLPVLFAALEQAGPARGLSLDCYGASGTDASAIMAAADQRRVRFHGAVSQRSLGEAFRRADLLVLPSWEEAFGLVVPQALACGLPVVVSDQVGAKDIVRHHGNGSVFPAGDATALSREIDHWLLRPTSIDAPPASWTDCARRLLDQIERRHRPSPKA